jgi:hypothetical protein
MRPKYMALAAAVAASLALAGCGGSTPPKLMHLRSGSSGPDEFAILPVKPLELPADLAALPEPTPGGANRVDPAPLADAVVALGGRAQDPTAASSGDAALLAYAARGGTSPDVRAVLAAEDLDFRSRNRGRPLERLFNVTTYFKSYRSQSLDQNAELLRWRAQGAATPSAPPAQ